MPVGDGKALEEVWILFLVDCIPLANRVRRSFVKLRRAFFPLQFTVGVRSKRAMN